mmetsp:Transcript_18427/g.50835  ORF Transcript_18427/g.50835 Transcript_18427/m.50835 type:complete len:449 (+) Transcript_18427:312-1658(+)
MEINAQREVFQANEDSQALKFLETAQNELNAYAANFQALSSISGKGEPASVKLQFPKEAAELHALIDDSLSRVDRLSVKLATARDQHATKVARTAAVRSQHSVHKNIMASITAPHPMLMSYSSAPKAAKPSHAAAAHGPSSNVGRELAKLDRVKQFEHSAAHPSRGTAQAAALSRALSSRPSPTQMLVQPGPLHGAMPVRGGALYRSGTLWDPEALGWERKEAEVGQIPTEEDGSGAFGLPESWKSSPTRYAQTTWSAILKQSKGGDANASAPAANGTDAAAANATGPANGTALAGKPVWKPENDVRLACNVTCRKAILASVVGISYKVAKQCVKGCATSDYTLRTYGAPLPSWSNIDELQDQDQKCDPDPEYMKCKLELLKPVCLKFEEVMPMYCLENPSVTVCATCSRLEQFMKVQTQASYSKRELAEMQSASPGADCPLGVSWLC